MTNISDALGKASGEHAKALRWFLDQTGRTVSWSDIQAYAEKGARLVTQAKGIYKPHYMEYALRFHQTTVARALDRPKVSRRNADQDHGREGSKSETLRLAIVKGYQHEEERAAWQDGENGRLESMMSEIAVEIVMTAELNYRKAA
jgi:hypothetical protein